MAAIYPNYSFPYPRTVVTPTQKLLRCWQDGVTKFGPASFYNFEQDNLPLYDLEERTYYNWQKLGFPEPGNVAPSIHLLVSSNAPAELVNCNSNIFTSLQEAVDSLPKYINSNVRISVASYGNLGQLRLDNFSINPDTGTLEIVNLNCYDRAGSYPDDATKDYYHFDAHASSFSTTNLANGTYIYEKIASSALADFNGSGSGGLASFIMKPDAGINFEYRPRVRDFDVDPYVTSAAAGAIDARLTSNNCSIFMTPIPSYGSTGAVRMDISRLTFGGISFSNPSVTSVNGSSVHSIEGLISPFEASTDLNIQNEIYLYDPSSYQQNSPNIRTVRNGQGNIIINDEPQEPSKATLYNNYLTRLRINNCQGLIYLRGFHCKGTGANGSKIGIAIQDSNNIVLESVAVTRYPEYGIKLTNSKITVERSFYVYRCYGFTRSNPFNTGTFTSYEGELQKRKSKLWSENIKSLEAPQDESAGIGAFNSEIYFSKPTVDINTFLRYPYTFFNVDITDAAYKSGVNDCKMIARCSTGIKLVNSVMHGGQGLFTGVFSTEASKKNSDFLNIEGNANYGIEAINSHINLESSLQVFHNTRGLKAVNSTIALDTFMIDRNHLYGMNLDQSKLVYGLVQLSGLDVRERFDYASNLIVDDSNSKRNQFEFIENGHHILAKNSVIEPGPLADPKPQSFGRMVFSDAHAADNQTNLLPSIVLDNTKATFIHLASQRLGINERTALGAHVLATNNSDVTFLGSEKAASVFMVPQSITHNEVSRYVGLVADKNSTFKFRGPTVIYDGAVNVLARNNSNIIFEPHKKADGSLDVSGFNLVNPANHTMVEVKSINSCLVADSGSNIVITDLGSYLQNWSAEQQELGNDYEDIATLNDAYTSAGFFQFYPNPNADSVTYAGLPYSTAINARGSTYKMIEAGGKYYWGFNYISPGVDGPFEFSAVTNGGVCLRATNNSNVRVRNVNFPCGWWNASSVVYDLNDLNPEYCSKTFIWNFANNSTLHADHLSVSSDYPSDVGYHGPSAIWTSGANNIAYGAPSSTPDTSTLSVLDFFGAGRENAWQLPGGTNVMYGFETPQNQGPFRLYVGVDSLANQLYQEGKPGYAPQVFAQGYNLSGSVSAVLTTSALYGKILRINNDGDLEPSGYYYSNEFVKPDPNAIRLDDSAANTFANAKNGAMGTSNRPQICSIYLSNTSITGEGKLPNTNALGSGFKSPNIFDILEEN